jgi:hypothetical protein
MYGPATAKARHFTAIDRVGLAPKSYFRLVISVPEYWKPAHELPIRI